MTHKPLQLKLFSGKLFCVPSTDGVTRMFINIARARDWIVDMHELTQSILLFSGLTLLYQMRGGVFKPRNLLVRTHTAGQSFVLTICFAATLTSAVTLPE